MQSHLSAAPAATMLLESAVMVVFAGLASLYKHANVISIQHASLSLGTDQNASESNWITTSNKCHEVLMDGLHQTLPMLDKQLPQCKTAWVEFFLPRWSKGATSFHFHIISRYWPDLLIVPYSV